MDRLAQRSDAELLSAVASGDGQAFAVFYRRHLPVVLTVLRRQGADAETCADLAAEVFAAVLTSARRYRPGAESAVPWLATIARNKLMSSFRRRRVEDEARRRLGFAPVQLEDEDLIRVDELAATGAEQLDELLQRLPAEQREALLARVVEERSYGDIAAAMKTSEMVIRKRVSRGLDRLRTQLGEESA